MLYKSNQVTISFSAISLTPQTLVNFVFVFGDSMDPANRKASTGLLSLEQNMQPKEEGSSNYSPTLPAAESSDNNFEMMEAQQMTPPNDALLDIEEESETLWADVDIETN